MRSIFSGIAYILEYSRQSDSRYLLIISASCSLTPKLSNFEAIEGNLGPNKNNKKLRRKGQTKSVRMSPEN